MRKRPLVMTLLPEVDLAGQKQHVQGTTTNLTGRPHIQQATRLFLPDCIRPQRSRRHYVRCVGVSCERRECLAG
jgi:hypothetical protein